MRVRTKGILIGGFIGLLIGIIISFLFFNSFF